MKNVIAVPRHERQAETHASLRTASSRKPTEADVNIPSICLLDTHTTETHQLLRKIQGPLRHPRLCLCCLLRQKWPLGSLVLRVLSPPFPYTPGPLQREGRRRQNPPSGSALIVLSLPSPFTQRKLRLREVQWPIGSGGRPRIQGPVTHSPVLLGPLAIP